MLHSRIKIIGGRIATPIRLLEDVEICIADGVIARLSSRDHTDDAGCEVIDAAGCIVAPGFIDIHVHGGGGFDFMDATPEAFLGAVRIHALHGTTTLLPTSLASPTGALLDMIDAYHRAVQVLEHDSSAVRPKGAHMPGLHLEGPYFSAAQAGAQDPSCITAPNPIDYIRILERSGNRILRWSAAPELSGAMAFGRYLRERNVLPSIGHSDATDTLVAEAIENGYTHITHLYSGMSSIVRKQSYRYPGVIESAYIYPDLTVEIIADGHHLPANLLQLVYRFLGPRRVALVTDALRGAGLPDGPSTIGGGANARPCVIEGGVAKLPDRSAFAGSVATGDRLVGNMVRLAGVPLLDALRMMTITPASIMGFKRIGMLAAGYDADIVFMDENLTAVRTLLRGLPLEE